MVLATQNPLDTEGTYPLPEAQLDRFLLKIDMTYPSLSEEVDIVTRTTTGSNRRAAAARRGDPGIERTRGSLLCSIWWRASASMRRWSIMRSASPARRATGRESPWAAGSRGPIALVRAAKAAALMAARSFVVPDDVKSVALAALRHRIALSADAQLDGRQA